MIGREELKEIRNKARVMATIPNQNSLWTRAWERLEDAANNLQAMIGANTIYGGHTEDHDKKV